VIQVQSQANLVQIVPARGAIRSFARFLHCRKKQPKQYSYNCNYNQKLD
jgi:hypothetical protein